MIVLHITDLHINEPLGCNEALRDSFYEHYLSDALKIVTKHQIDALVVTGDIVNLCKSDNYSHAQKVIDYIADELKLTSKQVFLVNGNHDVPRDSGDLADFNRFIEKYSGQPESESRDLYRIYNINSDNAVLCLNSIGDNFETGLPYKINPKVIDDIVVKIKGLEARNIIILSHHPANSFKVQQESMFDESPDWAPLHIWADGGYLFDRLGHHTANKEKLYWFAGDIHKSELAKLDSNKYTVTTGGLNCIDHTINVCKCGDKDECTCKSKHSHINPQMRVVNLKEASSVLLEFKPNGHENRGLVGQWKEDINPRITNISTGDDTSQLPNSSKATPTINNTNSQKLSPSISSDSPSVEQVRTCYSEFNVIDSQLEESLYTNVIEQNLYTKNFYRSKESITSLAWISITELFNNQSIYRDIISSFKKAIELEISEEVDKTDCLLLGLDNWGSILASRLGAATNIRSCCLAVSGSENSYEEDEIINEELKNIVDKKKLVIVVTDVVNSGNTINKVRKGFSTTTPCEWISLTVFADPSQHQKTDFSYYRKISYLCGALRLPLILTELL
ncbi:metallophosphoesterase [Vibrio parahaemolyticus]|uniref:metallophosphoesterase n=1 Tax=Vibrio parahaemolyticus TaxID=670 RepID=UPI00079FFBA5|nr:metallophosphoesterase [Vibrio parahaemolyticus]EGQ7737607.1 metallophosphoesterase [Vibrio parahaemolyticus]EGR1584006.1 hypothetical protein [Vibrio parahaemolyticus]EHK5158439.1 metallophosphoesterase [Vibrio parahaemolyticus]EHZ7318780.1 metallophosphoesterase [Vibrio parahaemolyticus]EIA4664303.1 metallophosphoesterase [Vibrio parahaemolyticus]